MVLRNKLDLFIMVFVGLSLGGCGKYRKTGAVPQTEAVVTPADPDLDGIIPTTPDHVDTIDTDESVWSSGGTATFVPVNNDVFNEWVGGHPVEPKNALINIQLNKVVDKSIYYGSVKIRYQHNTTSYEATLKSSSSSYDGKDFSMYNYWFEKSGKKVFSGFFDDQIGAIVLIIDQDLDLGDGGGASAIGGEVWFKNYPASWAPYDAGASWSVVLPCWLRTIGPYDCRSQSIINKSALYPTDGYQRLGRFSNMNKLKAFTN